MGDMQVIPGLRRVTGGPDARSRPPTSSIVLATRGRRASPRSSSAGSSSGTRPRSSAWPPSPRYGERGSHHSSGQSHRLDFAAAGGIRRSPFRAARGDGRLRRIRARTLDSRGGTLAYFGEPVADWRDRCRSQRRCRESSCPVVTGELVVASRRRRAGRRGGWMSALLLLTYRLRGHGRWTDAARDLLPVIVASVPLYAPAVALLALAYRDISPWTLPLFFAPALAAQRWFLLYQEQRRLASDLQVANEQLKAANLSFAKGLIATLDARDRYTAGHSLAVAIYARDIARRMALEEEQQELAHLCGLVHDIGKIGLPAGLLEKPGALTLEERREMQKHSEIGERILANVDTYCGDRGDRSAPPRTHRRAGLSRTGSLAIDSPAFGIIAVADAYNAMTSDRPYRDAMPSRVARLDWRRPSRHSSTLPLSLRSRRSLLVRRGLPACQGAEFELMSVSAEPLENARSSLSPKAHVLYRATA